MNISIYKSIKYKNPIHIKNTSILKLYFLEIKAPTVHLTKKDQSPASSESEGHNADDDNGNGYASGKAYPSHS